MARATFSSARQRGRFRLIWQTIEWPAVWTLALVALVLGCVGFAKHFAALGEPKSFLDVFHLTLQLFVLHSGHVPPPVPWQLEVARLLAPAVSAFTAIKALAVLFREQLQLLRIRLMRDHAVISGLGRKGLHLVKGFRARGTPVVVIEKDTENDRLAMCRALGAAVLVGDATDHGLLGRVGLRRASCLVSVCGGDAANAEVALHAREHLGGVSRKSRRSSPVSCVVHIFEPELCDLLREHEILSPRTGSFRVSFFNPFETGARAMLDEFSPLEPPGDGRGGAPHLLVIGLGHMGESLIGEAARRWWSAHRPTGARFRATVIDRLARQRVDALSLRYPRLEEACDARAVEIDVRSSEFQRGLFLSWSGGPSDVTFIFVCLDDESLGLSAALALHQRLRGHAVPIVVRTEEEAGLAKLLRGDDGSGRFGNLFGFGLLDRTCTPEFVLGGTRETLAYAIHTTFLRTRVQQGETRERNPAMAPWAELDLVFKESSRRQADHVRVKLDAVGCEAVPRRDWGADLFAFAHSEIELLAILEHERFMEERLAEGWKYAPGPRDLARKTNPCLVPWDDLSEPDKEIDRQTVRELPAFLAEVGFGIRRVAEVPRERGA
jgi:hypothetical protein